MSAESSESQARRPEPGAERTKRVIELLDAGLTPVFIAHYRKAAAGSQDETALRRAARLRRQQTSFESLRARVIAQLKLAGAWNDDVAKLIAEAGETEVLQDLLLPYKPGRRTAASVAEQRGLAPLANYAWEGPADGPDLAVRAADYVSHEKEIHAPEDALAGAGHILAERIANDPHVRQAVRTVVWEKGILKSEQAKPGGKAAAEFKGYFAFHEELKRLPPHRILAVNRGEHSKILKVLIEVPPEAMAGDIVPTIVKPEHRFRAYLATVALDALQRLVLPAMEREIRKRLTERAEEHAIDVFASNLRGMLMVPPVRGKRVLVLQPGFRSGCKIAALDAEGKLLGETIVYPHEPQKKWAEAKAALLDEIRRHSIDLVAIGNGTGCRDTEQLVSETFEENQLEVQYTIVSEAGAGVFADSEAAKREFPNLEAALRATVSVGRRLQDPLAELVKIDPRSIGVGLYQHDVDQGKLKGALRDVIESCVAIVGTDANKASPEMLAYVPGLTPPEVQTLCMKRTLTPLASREELKSLPGWDEKTFLLAAGFLRIHGPLAFDATRLHPESYALAERILQHIGHKPDDLKDPAGATAVSKALTGIPLEPLATALEIPLGDLIDLVGHLQRPDWDPRSQNPAPIFRRRLQRIEDLQPGMWVKGTVRNVVDFGAFVDIGLKEDGLVHISQFSKRYVRDPLRFLHVGDVVEARIVGIDRDRGRIALTLIAEEPPKPEPGAAKPAGEARREGGRRSGQAGRGRPSGPRPARKPPRPQPAVAQAGAGQAAASSEARPSAPRSAPRPPRQDRSDSRSKERSGRPPRPGSGRPRTDQPRIIVSKDTSRPEQPLGNDEKGRPKLRWADYESDLGDDATARDTP